jgi:hypothetical protein
MRNIDRRQNVAFMRKRRPRPPLKPAPPKTLKAPCNRSRRTGA